MCSLRQNLPYFNPRIGHDMPLCVSSSGKGAPKWALIPPHFLRFQPVRHQPNRITSSPVCWRDIHVLSGLFALLNNMKSSFPFMWNTRTKLANYNSRISGATIKTYALLLTFLHPWVLVMPKSVTHEWLYVVMRGLPPHQTGKCAHAACMRHASLLHFPLSFFSFWPEAPKLCPFCVRPFFLFLSIFFFFFVPFFAKTPPTTGTSRLIRKSDAKLISFRY